MNTEKEVSCERCAQPLQSDDENFGSPISPLCRKCYGELLILKEVQLKEVEWKLRKIIKILNVASRAHANAIHELYEIVGPPHDDIDLTDI